MNVSLTPQLEKLVERRVASGKYNSASEVVRTALRLLEQREKEDKARIEWLRSAAHEGFDEIERGNFTTLTSRKELAGHMKGLRRRADSELQQERKDD